MKISHLEHLVLTVKDIEATCQFYPQIMGMEEVTFQRSRKGLLSGNQKINLHQYQREFEPKAQLPTPGSADLCFIIQGSMEDAMAKNAKTPYSNFRTTESENGSNGKTYFNLYLRSWQ